MVAGISEGLDQPLLLRPGDRVRIVAPSGPVSAERLEAGVSSIREMGLEPVCDPEVLTRDGFLAGDDERRCNELLSALADDDSRAIWAARGGYGSTRLLPHIDSEDVRRSAKWLIGFSDVTALHGLWRRAGLSSVHGANVTTLGDWGAPGRDDLAGALFEGRPAALEGTEGLGSGIGSGPLAGGNLRVLCAMVGTPYFPSLEGSVLLIEDVNEAPYQLDRVFTQLVQAGALEGVVGIAVGQLSRCGDADSGLDVVRQHAQRIGLPTVIGLPVGHEPDSRAAILGSVAIVDPQRRELRYQA